MRILYQDSHYVGIYKPPGMLVHRTNLDPEEDEVCVQLLRKQLGQEVYPCHRLDRPTCGVLLFALNKEALRGANGAFAEGRVEKVYRAVVRGWIEKASRIDYPLVLEDPHRRDAATQKVQDAVTDVRCLERFEHPVPLGRYQSARFSIVELIPRTGRTHQLRRHMAHVRHPIIGDTRHGDGLQNRFFRQNFNCHRLLLASISLTLDHPVTGESMRVESEPDTDFMEVLQSLKIVH